MTNASITARGGGAPKGRWYARNVVVLGFVSLLNDAAGEMVVPLLPAFLTGALGAGPLALGWIEGVADAVASLLKLVSGWWADRLGRFRPLVFAGYLLATAARPLFAAASAAWHVLLIRAGDRTGKGLRTSPRDALIAYSVRGGEAGGAFGLHRAMDHAGAVLGPLLAAAYLAYWSEDLRLLFLLSAVPGVLSLAVLWFGVREPKLPARGPQPAPGAAAARAPGNPRLRRFLYPLALFTLGRASDVFLLLKAGGSQTTLSTLPLYWMGLHAVKALLSVPGGRLADRFGRVRIIALGWAVFAGVYLGFAFSEDRTLDLALFLVYGLHHALTEGPERALVAALTPKGGKGVAFGWFHAVLGFLTLAASVLFGALWEYAGRRWAFLTGAVLGAIATLWLLLAGRALRSTRPPAG